MPTTTTSASPKGERRGTAQEKIDAAAAVSVAWVEGNDCPAPHPTGAATWAGSARQGRTRATAGLTTRTETRSATPTATSRSAPASARCGDFHQRYSAASRASAKSSPRLEAASITASSQGVPGRLRKASIWTSMVGGGAKADGLYTLAKEISRWRGW